MLLWWGAKVFHFYTHFKDVVDIGALETVWPPSSTPATKGVIASCNIIG